MLMPMTNTKIFAAALSRIRKDRGFPSAYKFFKAVGGSKALGMAFVSYWDIELMMKRIRYSTSKLSVQGTMIIFVTILIILI